METEYQEMNEKIVEHFLNPRNIGEIKNPDGMAVVGDPSCGDHIKIWIKVANEIITDFKYKVFGCWGAISTTSVVSELAIGKPLKEAIKISDDDVTNELGGIPENKQHCSLLGVQGLRAAIADYLLRDNHRKYQERIDLYKSYQYDIPNIRDKMVELIDHTDSDIKILDVGTGKGHLAISLAKSGLKCTAIDISTTELYMAQLNAIHFQVDEKIDFQHMDAFDMSFEKDSFDIVMSALLIHHLDDTEEALQEMVRVCKNQGSIVISDINENGKDIIADIHSHEGKKHEICGWSISEIVTWFEEKQCKVKIENLNCETIIHIHNNK